MTNKIVNLEEIREMLEEDKQHITYVDEVSKADDWKHNLVEIKIAGHNDIPCRIATLKEAAALNLNYKFIRVQEGIFMQEYKVDQDYECLEKIYVNINWAKSVHEKEVKYHVYCPMYCLNSKKSLTI